MSRPFAIPFWKAAPLLRLLLPLMFGIVAGWYLQPELKFTIACILSFLVALVIFRFFPASLQYRFRLFQGFIIHLLIFFIGVLLVFFADERNDKNWYGYHLKPGSGIVAEVSEPWVKKNKTYKNTLRVLSVENNGLQEVGKGSVIAYFTSDSSSLLPQPGSIILIRGNLAPIANGGNPGSFNYQRYSAFKNLYHQAFIKPNDWALLKAGAPDPFHAMLFRTRAHVLEILNKYIPGKDEKAIAAALLIGYKDDLDKDLVQAYSNTGIVHIIAISGLHLGIIYGLFSFLFAKISFIKKRRILHAGLIILVLWVFAIITGGSPSVLRSAVMFTMIVIGKSMFRQTTMYNSLASSAFLLLIFNPYLLWDVGFQLSYMAVLGIAAWQQPLYRSFYISFKPLRKIWEMLSISVAAQISTLPFVIYYFHQFPVLFFITNIFAVPLAAVLVNAELLLVLLSWLPLAAKWIGIAIGKLISMLNYLVAKINNLPFSLWDNIYASLATSSLLFAALFFATLWFRTKRIRWGIYFLFCLVGFSVLHVVSILQATRQEKIVFYNVPGKPAIDFIYGSEYYFLGDTVLAERGIQQNFHLKPSRNYFHLDSPLPDSSLVMHNGALWQFRNKTLLLLSGDAHFRVPDKALLVDIVLLQKNYKGGFDEILRIAKPALIIADGSNSLWKIQSWKEEAKQLALPFHSVTQQGAYILNIR